MRPPRPLVALLVAVLLLGGCSLLPGGDDESGGPAPAGDDGPAAPLTAWERADAADVAEGGEVRLAVTSLPASLNPDHADALGSELGRLLDPTRTEVVRTTEDGGWEVDPDLAESVEVVSGDPFTVRVRLNPDAVWQDGDPVTSADMVATWRALRGADDRFRVGSSEGWDDVRTVRRNGAAGYDVVLERPRADWPLYVSPHLPAAVAGSPQAFNGLTDTAPPSNGPFVTTSVDRESGTVTQERNPRWWGQAPRAERIVWRVATPEVQAEAFEAGELDVATLDAASLDTVDGDRVQRASGSSWAHLTLNAGGGPLRDVEVRRAVSLALDRQALAAAAAEPLGTPARPVDSLLLVPGQAGYDEVAEPFNRNVARARELLAEAGYEVDGDRAVRDGEPLVLDLPVPAGDPAVEARAQAVADDLAEVGIGVEVREVAVDAFTDDVLVPFDYDLLTFSWPATLYGPGPAEQRFRPVTSPSNLTGVASGQAQQWAAAVGRSDPAAQQEALRALDTALRRAAVVVPLHVLPSVVAVREGVVNVGAGTFEQPDWTVVGVRADD